MLTMNAMQKAALDGMRLCCHTLFWSAEVFQDQMQRTWAMIMEQQGKMRSEMDDLMAMWMRNAHRARDELKLNLEKGLDNMEESASKPGDGYRPLAGIYMYWPEMQIEAFRAWMGIWGFPAAPGAESGKQTADGQAGKGK